MYSAVTKIQDGTRFTRHLKEEGLKFKLKCNHASSFHWPKNMHISRWCWRRLVLVAGQRNKSAATKKGQCDSSRFSTCYQRLLFSWLPLCSCISFPGTVMPSAFNGWLILLNAHSLAHLAVVITQHLCRLIYSHIIIKYVLNLWEIINLPPCHIQGVTGGTDQTSGGCSLC